MSKYFKYKQKTFLFVGFTWIGLTSLWMAKSISVIYNLVTNSDLDIRVFILIGNFTIPITVIIWLFAFTTFTLKKYKKELILCFSIIGLLMEGYILYFIFADPTELTVFIPPIDANYNLIMTIYHISLVCFIFSTGFTIGWISLKSENSEVKLKGKFIILSTYSFILGGLIEIFSYLGLTLMIVGKLILVMSAILYYAGWLLPDWIKKLFLRQE
ncbi:MAG: hypothetical protein KGD57_06370 [Candidatus Lokiarchaeota archaeon]|nr:hypothetical protein [Candidatus Lokiarchaeota archaeon]